MPLICFFLACILLPDRAYSSAEKNSHIIAVLPIHSINCSQSIGDSVTEILVTKLYDLNYLSVLDRIQIERQLNAASLPIVPHISIEAAARYGAALKADTVIFGSVERSSGYNLNILVVDVKNPKRHSTIEGKAFLTRDLVATIDRSVVDIDRHYQGYTKLERHVDVSIFGSSFIPFGPLQKGFQYSAGGGLRLFFMDVYRQHLCVSPSLSAYSVQHDYSGIKSMAIIHGEILVGRSFELRRLRITPLGGMGLFSTYMNRDKDGGKENGAYRYQPDAVHNLSISASCEISFLIYDRWNLFLSPSVCLLPESDKSSIIPGLSAGITVNF